MIPGTSQGYEAARGRAAFLDRSDRGRIAVAGADRESYLNGLLTNDIAALTAGRGCYAAYLTAQGRMIADMWVYETGDAILMTLDSSVKDAVLAKLDQFVFSEDVQLGDVTGTFGQVAIVGPQAAAAVAQLVDGTSAAALAAMGEHENLRAQRDEARVIVTRVTDTGEPGFELYVDRDRLVSLIAAIQRLEITELDAATADALRIEAGIPQFHRDMDEETIPLEAGIEGRAISFTKGCYVGQEVIIRVLHRGHGRVVRKLVGLKLDGSDAPAAGSAVRAGDREIGKVTSSTWSPALKQPIALAYLHRDFLEPGTKVAVAEQAADVSTLPFV